MQLGPAVPSLMLDELRGQRETCWQGISWSRHESGRRHPCYLYSSKAGAGDVRDLRLANIVASLTSASAGASCDGASETSTHCSSPHRAGSQGCTRATSCCPRMSDGH